MKSHPIELFRHLELGVAIKKVYDSSKDRYGSPRIVKDLQMQGCCCISTIGVSYNEKEKSHKCDGWQVGNNLTSKDTMISSLNKVCSNRTLIAGQLVIFHSDRIQYACNEFKKLIKKH